MMYIYIEFRTYTILYMFGIFSPFSFKIEDTFCGTHIPRLIIFEPSILIWQFANVGTFFLAPVLTCWKKHDHMSNINSTWFNASKRTENP